ncbi:MAG TPA: glutathione S-transferase family protein [Stellaceae bacterium]|nr:glutathione S-transferase family protein [Stellaceae bacterium]
MIRLYNFQESGNSYKIRLLLTQLQVPFERVDIDLLGGETGTPRFRARNPLGQTPFVEFDDGRVLAESNAILWHFAEGTPFLPEDRWTRAQILQWMNFEQYRLEPNIGTPRFWITELKVGDERRTQIAEKLKSGNTALAIVDAHLAKTPFLAGSRYSIADICLFAYGHVAEEAGYDLAPYPALRQWFARVQAEPRHVAITAELGRVIPWPEPRAS